MNCQLGIRNLGCYIFFCCTSLVSQAACLTLPEVIVLVVEKSLKYHWDKNERVPKR